MEEDLGLDELYVLGTNCVDNPRNAEAVRERVCKAGMDFTALKQRVFEGALKNRPKPGKRKKRIWFPKPPFFSGYVNYFEGVLEA